VQYRTVSDMTIHFHNGVGARKSMHHAGILDVRTVFYDQSSEVAAQAARRTNVATSSDDNVPDQYCGRM
jgi:hypothetical protein